MSDGHNPFDDRAEAVLSVFKRGAEFTREILDDNQRLRAELDALRTRQHNAAQNEGDWETLRCELLERVGRLEANARRSS